MTFMRKHLSSTFSRRSVLSGLSAFGLAATLANPLLAFSAPKAEALITRVVADITSIINSGRSESAMFRDFERLFAAYADVPRIAQLVLGPDNRRASSAQRSAFAVAFQGYMARKYGRRFREFIGGRLAVNGTRSVKSFYEVSTTAHLAGEAPFEVTFVVADSNGRFIDMKIEGISLIKAERTEVGAMLDRRRGNVDALIADLKRAG